MFKDRSTQVAIPDLRKSPQNRNGIAILEEGQYTVLFNCLLLIASLEKEMDGDLQCRRNQLELAGADPVEAFFILLDLLEGDTDFISQSLLAEAIHDPSDPNPLPHEEIDPIGRPLKGFGHIR